MAAATMCLAAVMILATQWAAASSVVVVAGATGRTGSLLFNLMKSQGVQVRGLVMNVTKARDVPNCSSCDASEGIFEGDVTKKESLTSVMNGASVLAIVSSASPHCVDFKDPKTCSFPKGGMPVDIDFHGGKALVEAFAEHAAAGAAGHVVQCSSMATTDPDFFLEKIGNGHIGFFELNQEAFVMSSGLPFTIVKPCGLTNDKPGQRHLLVGHDNDLHVTPHIVLRADVEGVMAEAVAQPAVARNLRFDLCSQAGQPTTDLSALLVSARWPWQAIQHRTEWAI